MTYIPTKEELEELGFIDEPEYGQMLLDLEKSNTNIYYKPGQELNFFMVVWEELGYGSQGLYPQSLDDIRILIRLLTPQ